MKDSMAILLVGLLAGMVSAQSSDNNFRTADDTGQSVGQTTASPFAFEQRQLSSDDSRSEGRSFAPNERTFGPNERTSPSNNRLSTDGSRPARGTTFAPGERRTDEGRRATGERPTTSNPLFPSTSRPSVPTRSTTATGETGTNHFSSSTSSTTFPRSTSSTSSQSSATSAHVPIPVEKRNELLRNGQITWRISSQAPVAEVSIGEGGEPRFGARQVTIPASGRSRDSESLFFDLTETQIKNLDRNYFHYEVPPELKDKVKNIVIRTATPPATAPAPRAQITQPPTQFNRERVETTSFDQFGPTNRDRVDPRWNVSDNDRQVRTNQPTRFATDTTRFAGDTTRRTDDFDRRTQTDFNRDRDFTTQTNFDRRSAEQQQRELWEENQRLQERNRDLQEWSHQREQELARVRQPFPERTETRSLWEQPTYPPTYTARSPFPVSPTAPLFPTATVVQPTAAITDLHNENRRLKHEIEDIRDDLEYQMARERKKWQEQMDLVADQQRRGEETYQRRGEEPRERRGEDSQVVPISYRFDGPGPVDKTLNMTDGPNRRNNREQPRDENRRGSSSGVQGLTLLLLLISAGLNVYLWWLTRTFHARYDELAHELRDTFASTVS